MHEINIYTKKNLLCLEASSIIILNLILTYSFYIFNLWPKT